MTTDAPAPTKKPIEIGPPHMWPEEAAAFQRLLDAVSASYMEFGMGGSTLLAFRRAIHTIVAVDSDPNWAASIASHPEIAPAIASGRAAILHANIGPVGNFGSPATRESVHRWPSYIAVPWAEWERRGQFPEFVFVDGRFRVACCLSVIVARMLMGCQDADPVVVIHDVQPARAEYDRALEFYDVVQTTRTLREMRIKPTASPMRAMLKLLECQFDGL